MKKIALMCLVLLFSVFIAGSWVNAKEVPKKLDRMNWSERNYQVLNQFITDYGKGGKFYDDKKAPYVVLDWDQTCAHFDVEEAVMRYQLVNLRYKMTKEQFKGLLKDEINGVTKLNEDYKNIALKDINEDLINDYNFLYDNFSGLGGGMSLEDIQKTPQYMDFLSKLPFLYDGYCETKGIEAVYGYPWVLYLLAGHTVDEVKALTKETIAYELGNKLSKQKWVTPENFPTKAGAVSYSYKTGLRVYPEMQDLIAAFEANGIDVFVVSASYKPVVEVFSGIGNFGYNVPSERVIAMELASSPDGKILPEYKPGWVQTQRQGKVEAINMVIKKNLGKNWDPLFSAADSDGDYEMSTGFPGMKLTLVWNRVKGGDIGKISKQAVDEKDSKTPRFILQGRNENTGIVIPSSESILIGKTEPLLLK
jgi:phosphoserine phosphatase